MTRCDAEHVHAFPDGSETLQCVYHKGHQGDHLVYVGEFPFFFEQSYKKKKAGF